MPYTVKDGQDVIIQKLNSFLFYTPFVLGPSNDVQLVMPKTGGGTYLALLVDGGPKMPGPKPAEQRRGKAAHEKVVIQSTDERIGALAFEDLTLVSQIQIERDNEWSEMRIYHGASPGTGPGNWIDSSGWKAPEPMPSRKDDEWTKRFSFDDIEGAICDETVIVRDLKLEVSMFVLCRRLTEDTIAERILRLGHNTGAKAEIPPIKVTTTANSDDIDSPAEQMILTNPPGTGGTNRFGYVMIAAGVFAYENADTLLEEWRPDPTGGGTVLGMNSLDKIRRKLSRIAYAPDNVPTGATRLLRKLNNVDHDLEDGITTGLAIDDAPIEVLYLDASGAGSLT